MTAEKLFTDNIWLLLLILAWTLPWKGAALWKAARRDDRWWFVALLLLNTLAVLDILYIFIWGEREFKNHKNLKEIRH